MAFPYFMRCVFCDIIQGRGVATRVYESDSSLGIVPLNPVTPGHVIFLSRSHVDDAIESPYLTSLVMMDAARYIQDQKNLREIHSANIITSIGSAATQTVYHLHIHVVPRLLNDGLKLPWSNQ